MAQRSLTGVETHCEQWPCVSIGMLRWWGPGCAAPSRGGDVMLPRRFADATSGPLSLRERVGVRGRGGKQRLRRPRPLTPPLPEGEEARRRRTGDVEVVCAK